LHSLSSAALRELRKSGEPPARILNAGASIFPPQAGFIIFIPRDFGCHIRHPSFHHGSRDIIIPGCDIRSYWELSKIDGTESAIPKTSGGSWDPCNLDEEILSSLEQEGLIAAKEISEWRLDPKAAAPAPSKKEIVMLKSHIDWGLSLLPSYFLKSMLRHYML
jgi:hypothetical protein